MLPASYHHAGPVSRKLLLHRAHHLTGMWTPSSLQAYMSNNTHGCSVTLQTGCRAGCPQHKGTEAGTAEGAQGRAACA